MGHFNENTPEKFWSRFDTKNKNRCWIWSFKNIDGFGIVVYKKKRWLAHRLAYKLSFGKISKDKIISHKCNDHACCNPSHLIMITKGAKRKDWTNQKYGKLTFLKPTNKLANGGSVIWKAKCDCGSICFLLPADAKRGSRKSCGCLPPNADGGNSRIYEPRISSARAIKNNAYKDCDFDIFYTLSQMPCHYCGRPPHRTYNLSSSKTTRYKISERQKLDGYFTYNGLDRIDSNKGHTKDNIVPCCSTCNYMKRIMGYVEFLSHVELMHNHIRSNNFLPITYYSSLHSSGVEGVGAS
jgi:hypothetical protein